MKITLMKKDGTGIRNDIKLRVDLHKGHKITVDHKMVTEWVSIGISGQFENSGGQCQDEIRKKLPLLANTELVEEILNIWDEWHLNDLNAGCMHQDSIGVNEGNWQQRANVETAKCPHLYPYGSAWLLKEIPFEVVQRVMFLFGEDISKHENLMNFYNGKGDSVHAKQISE